MLGMTIDLNPNNRSQCQESFSNVLNLTIVLNPKNRSQPTVTIVLNPYERDNTEIRPETVATKKG
jgi:hypothetical protein